MKINPYDGGSPDDRQVIINQAARGVEVALNGVARGIARQTGFVLMVFPFDRVKMMVNYIDNGIKREDLIVLMREQLAILEGQPETSGRA